MEGGRMEVETRRIADATNRLFDLLLSEEDPGAILGSLARIVGETLGVDRSLIYDISFSRDEAECLTEWLTPANPAITTTKANYPLALFRSAAELAFRTQQHLESHVDRPHPAMIADGSGPILHEQMNIASLLWYPFAFRDDGFYLLVFNHVSHTHVWDAAELAFVQTAMRHVSMALWKIALLRERARAEEVMATAQKVESLGLLAGGVAHDFNNLMVVVITGAELMERRLPADSPLLEIVHHVGSAGKRAAALAGQLLAYAGDAQPDLTTADLSHVVKSTIELVQSSMAGVPIELAVTASPHVECNVSQLEQVVMNLVINAGEAMVGRPGKVRVNVDRVELADRDCAAYHAPTTVTPGPYGVIEVVDSGEGMAPATLKRIFDPFFSTKRSGRGLGLSAVLGIVRRHRGAIRITSTLGVGTAFQVVWPAPGA